MSSIKRPFSKVISRASPSVPLSIAMRSPARSPTPEILRPRAFSPSTTVERRVSIGLAWCQHADRDAAAAVVAGSALEIRQFGRLDAGYHKRVLGEDVAADQRAAAVGEQGIGFEGWTRAFVELAFKPLDIERSAEALGNSLRKRDVKPTVGLSALMDRKGRQVLVEADFQRIFRRAHGRRRRK